jgi:hypothetical protein
MTGLEAYLLATLDSFRWLFLIFIVIPLGIFAVLKTCLSFAEFSDIRLKGVTADVLKQKLKDSKTYQRNCRSGVISAIAMIVAFAIFLMTPSTKQVLTYMALTKMEDIKVVAVMDTTGKD